MLARMWRKNTFALLGGMQTGAVTLENSMEVPQKIKNRTTLPPSDCTTRYLSKGFRCAVSKGQKERETQNPKQAPGSELSAQSPMQGSDPQTKSL